MSQNIPLYLSRTHECEYLDGEIAQTAFIPKEVTIPAQLFGQLLQHGFRRSGHMVYRPHCPNCAACIPTRIPVETFKPSRGQRRIWNKNQDIECRIKNSRLENEHYALYLKYQMQRHGESGMAQFTEQEYDEFFCQSFSDSVFLELYLDDRLVALSVVDQVPDGLSAVYTIFEPDLAERSLGTFTILKQVEMTRDQSKNHLYLGYLIRDCQKMSYKSNFQPLEGFIHNQWRSISRSE